MKGQSSIEYIAIIGVILVVSIPLFYYITKTSGDNIRINKADDAVSSLANKADLVYSSGLGSKDFVWVNIPSGVKAASVSGNNLILNLSIFGGTSEFVSYSKAELNATTDFINKISTQGTYKFPVETFRDSDGKVKVLLGGFCGDNICSSTEDPTSCLLDCTSYCGDLFCDSSEDCTCSDCYGESNGCPAGQICDSQGSGSCVSTTQITCGDGICTGLPGDNCNTCPADCPIPTGYVCCPYDPEQNYYVLWNDDKCPEVPPSVSNCGDYCVYIGTYNNGVCRQSEAQCTKFNEVYTPAGDPWCTGDPTIDKCCCQP
ncbi:MAG: hypothetical protein AABW46_02135 [Nanoarchaeota archaeon]